MRKERKWNGEVLRITKEAIHRPCLFSLPSPTISFPTTIFYDHPRSRLVLFGGALDTRESWASFEELISFVSFQRALDAVAYEDPVTGEAGSKATHRQTRE